MRGPVRRVMVSLALSAAISCGDGGTEPDIQVTLLTVGTPLADRVTRGETNFYAVPVTPGALYQVTLTGLSDDVDLYPFDDDGSFSFLAACLTGQTLRFGTDAEACAAGATRDTMYIAIDASDVAAASATYTIAVTQLQTTALTLGSPLEGSVANGATNFYTVGITQLTAYSVSITGLTDSAASFHVGASDQVVRFTDRNSPKDLRFVALGSRIYLAVEGSGLVQPTADFRILAMAAPVITGPITPTSGPVPARTPTVGWVETRQTSQYRADGLPAGTHTISIVGPTGDVNLRVYANETYTQEINCTLLNAGARECTFTGTSVFFAVSAGPVNTDGAGYIMLVW